MTTRYTNLRLPCLTSSTTLQHSFRSFLASPCLWNELSKELRKPVDDESLSLSSHLCLTGSSLSSSSPLSLCITPSQFPSSPDSKLTFSINSSHHDSLPHFFGEVSRIFVAISGLNRPSFFCFVFLLSSFCSFRVID